MSEKKRPLPKPPGSAFGQKRKFDEGEEKAGLIVDKIAMAMAEGKLEEFMEKEIPEGEHARALTMMMMGMTGMMPGMTPPGGPGPASPGKAEGASGPESEEAARKEAAGIQPPEDVLKAVHDGDVEGLAGLLEREYRKLNPDAGPPFAEDDKGKQENPSGEGGIPAGPSLGEKEILDQLLEIAQDNKLDPDWIILRALRLYIREYKKTGRL